MPILTEGAFPKALSAIGISVKRARLYARQLFWARDRLMAIANDKKYNAANLPAGDWSNRLRENRNTRNLDLNYNVFARALSGKNLFKLMLNLAKQLDPWAAYYIHINRNAGPRDSPLQTSRTYEDLLERILKGKPFTVNSPDPPAGAGADMPPSISVSIERTTYHFVDNLATACARIFNDWNNLNEAFSPYIPWMKTTHGRPDYPIFEQVERFRPTGSDYHKGGRQVVLVDFALVPGRVGPTNRTNKKPEDSSRRRLVRQGKRNANVLDRGEYGIETVVYKPGDVELDCRIVGDSAVVKKIRPTGYEQSLSISEWINQQLESPANRSLPTYVILPYHSGSTLAATAKWNCPPNEKVLDVRQSYGYIQYLTHEPDCEIQGNTTGAFRTAFDKLKRQNWLDDSDYITDDPNHKNDYFSIWGQLMALCVTFSMSDFHSQNTIVHRSPYSRTDSAYPPPDSVPKPHLIDLEDGFKWPMDLIRETAIINENINKVYLDESELRVKNDSTLEIDGDFVPKGKKLEKNQCYFLSKGKASRQRPELDTRVAMCEGFVAVMERFRNKEDEIKELLKKMADTLARFVPIPTGQFYKMLRSFSNDSLSKLDRKAAQIIQTLSAWDSSSSSRSPSRTAWNLYFCLDHPEHNFYDFDNMDIPYYVHALGKPHLLNSRGMRVDVSEGFKYVRSLDVRTSVDLEHLTTCRNDLTPLQVHDYFPLAALDLVLDQVHKLNTDEFFRRVTAMLKEILWIPGHRTGDILDETEELTIPDNLVIKASGGTFTYEWNKKGGPADPANPERWRAGWNWRVKDETGAIQYQKEVKVTNPIIDLDPYAERPKQTLKS